MMLMIGSFHGPDLETGDDLNFFYLPASLQKGIITVPDIISSSTANILLKKKSDFKNR